MVAFKIILLFVVIFSLKISCAEERSSVSIENMNYDSDSSGNELGLYFEESMSFESLDCKETSSSELSLRGSSGLGIKLEEIADRRKVTVLSSKKDTENKDTIVVKSNTGGAILAPGYSCKRKKDDQIRLDDNHKPTKKSHSQFDIMQKDTYQNHAFYNSYSGYRK